MQANRLFEIIYLLLNKKMATAKELAEHFGVSQRTIYRDVDVLSLAGIPVYTEKGKGGGVFHDLKTAILERRTADFDYYSTFGEKTCRRIEPIQLWFKSKAWYIKGFCLTRQDIRLFKLTRVKNLTVTNELFTQRELLTTPPNPSPAEHQKRDVTLKLRIAPELAYRVYDEFDEDMVEKQDDGSFFVTVTWPKDEWVYSRILSFGEHMEVLEPEHIREIIKNKTLKTVKKYL